MLRPEQFLLKRLGLDLEMRIAEQGENLSQAKFGLLNDNNFDQTALEHCGYKRK